MLGMMSIINILWIFNLLLPSSGLNFIDVHEEPISEKQLMSTIPRVLATKNKALKFTSSTIENLRRNLREGPEKDALKKIEEEHDKNLKNKISILVQQTIHDTTKKIEGIQHIKAAHRDKPAYKVGFLINLIKKSKDVVNELFSVGVKHREDWKALEQMKTFEMLVHANVDTDNLVKQLVDITSAFKTFKKKRRRK